MEEFPPLSRIIDDAVRLRELWVESSRVGATPEAADAAWMECVRIKLLYAPYCDWYWVYAVDSTFRIAEPPTNNVPRSIRLRRLNAEHGPKGWAVSRRRKKYGFTAQRGEAMDALARARTICGRNDDWMPHEEDEEVRFARDVRHRFEYFCSLYITPLLDRPTEFPTRDNCVRGTYKHSVFYDCPTYTEQELDDGTNYDVRVFTAALAELKRWMKPEGLRLRLHRWPDSDEPDRIHVLYAVRRPWRFVAAVPLKLCALPAIRYGGFGQVLCLVAQYLD